MIKMKPGILVSIKATMSGGIHYQRIDLEQKTEGDREISRWETVKEITDPEEHKRAAAARNKARYEIERVCYSTAFGALCPLDRETELDASIKRARAIVEEYNATALHSQITVRAIKGKIAATDEEAARAIAEEVSDLIGTMNAAIDKLDPKAIRDAANKARETVAMLGDEQAATVDLAVEAARKAARTIVKRIEKDGENAATVLASIQRADIEKARIAFLDLDGNTETSEALPAVNVQRFADLG